MRIKPLLSVPPVLIAVALIGWGGLRVYQEVGSFSDDVAVPTSRVRRGDVTFTVTSHGEIHGTKSEMLTAPMTGSGELVITSLRSAGEVVKAGDVVVRFDTTEEDFNLREAEADLAP